MADPVRPTLSGMPRQVANCRGKSHLVYVRDVPINRGWRDQEFLAERHLDAVRVEIALCAIPLNAAWRPWDPGALVAREGLLDRKGIVGVVAGRGMPRQVGACRTLLMIARRANRPAVIPSVGRDKGAAAGQAERQSAALDRGSVGRQRVLRKIGA
jgi:hypothetical protein